MQTVKEFDLSLFLSPAWSLLCLFFPVSPLFVTPINYQRRREPHVHRVHAARAAGSAKQDFSYRSLSNGEAVSSGKL